jgi:SnoaL-like protein
MANGERFLQRYMEVWPSFDADRLDVAIDPEATIHHSGMATPIRGDEEPDYVRAIKGLMPDISLEVINWAANNDVVFIEYEMSGTLAGRPLTWTGIGRFKLRGERAVDAIGRWDNCRKARGKRLVVVKRRKPAVAAAPGSQRCSALRSSKHWARAC